MASEDAALVDCCLAGDASAIRNLIERYQSDVLGLCIRMLHHRQDAEDVTQEVFVRVFRSLHRWDNTRPLKPWIAGITVNRCRTWLSQRAKRPDSVDYLQETIAGFPEDDSRELIQEIRDAVDLLREDYRTVFILFHEQGQPYEEIAQALARPVGTIKTWLHRARMEVMERLQRRGMIDEEESNSADTVQNHRR